MGVYHFVSRTKTRDKIAISVCNILIIYSNKKDTLESVATDNTFYTPALGLNSICVCSLFMELFMESQCGIYFSLKPQSAVYLFTELVIIYAQFSLVNKYVNYSLDLTFDSFSPNVLYVCSY